MPCAVTAQVGGNGFFGLFRHANFAHRGFARGHIEHDGNFAGGRQRDRDRIVADDALGAARRRHQGAGVAHRDADAAGLGRLQRITSCGAEMKAVAHRYDAGGELPSLVDRNRHGLDAG